MSWTNIWRSLQTEFAKTLFSVLLQVKGVFWRSARDVVVWVWVPHFVDISSACPLETAFRRSKFCVSDRENIFVYSFCSPRHLRNIWEIFKFHLATCTRSTKGSLAGLTGADHVLHSSISNAIAHRDTSSDEIAFTFSHTTYSSSDPFPVQFARSQP